MLNKSVQQLDLNHTYATVTITENTVFKPHRDKFNDPYSLYSALLRYDVKSYATKSWIPDESVHGGRNGQPVCSLQLHKTWIQRLGGKEHTGGLEFRALLSIF